jgi:hypothetical protein
MLAPIEKKPRLKNVCFRIPSEWISTMDDVAQQRKTTKTELVRSALWEYFSGQGSELN